MAITGCTYSADSTYNLYTGGTPTVHPSMNTVEYNDELSAYIITESIQYNLVQLGGNGVFS
jgi:hypothetical protein